MATLRLKGRISRDHKVTVDVPAELPECDVRVIVEVPETTDRRAAKAASLAKIFLEIEASPGSGRTKEEIDAYLAEERASWGDRP